MATTNTTTSAVNGTTPTTTTTYKILRVPRASPRLADLVTKSRTTRLHALETDPTSFLAQHATEAALPLEVWHKRLSNPQTTILACVASTSASNIPASAAVCMPEPVDSEEDVNALLLGEWVSLAAIRGPMSRSSYYASPDMGLPIPDHPESEARWHVYDLYTLPGHRGKGLAKKLVRACVETAVEYTQGLPATASTIASTTASPDAIQQARIRLFMNPANTWLIKMYESLGFEAAGKVTLEEGFRANGLDESIPANTRETEEGRKMWHTRFGLAMEQVVRVV